MSEILPVPEFDAVTVVFGAPSEAFVSREDGSKYEREFAKEASVANKIFFKGGTLAEYGLKLKPEVDSKKAHLALRALLCSWNPPHEAKIGTVARYLNSWCDHCEPETSAPEAKSEPSKPNVQRASKKWRKKK